MATSKQLWFEFQGTFVSFWEGDEKGIFVHLKSSKRLGVIEEGGLVG
jgi:hypothetical protein